MPDDFDTLGQLTFDGVAFPVEGYRVQGGQRKHVHSYPKADGGLPEKLGRELYSVQVQALFDTSLADQYPGLWPNGLRQLLAKFETGTTGNLFLPTRGTLTAFADHWSIEMSAKVRSGERAEISFLEDGGSAFTLKKITPAHPESLQAQALSLDELRATYDADLSDSERSVFDKIDDAVNDVRAIRDTGEMWQGIAAAKVERVTNLCREADGLRVFQDCRAWPLLEAVKELWATAVSIGEDIAGKRTPIDTYTVPALMALPAVARAIYGDATRGSDLLDLNFFRDAYAIPAGTLVRYYA